jgi:hypothetical protein
MAEAALSRWIFGRLAVPLFLRLAALQAGDPLTADCHQIPGPGAIAFSGLARVRFGRGSIFAGFAWQLPLCTSFLRVLLMLLAGG